MFSFDISLGVRILTHSLIQDPEAERACRFSQPFGFLPMAESRSEVQLHKESSIKSTRKKKERSGPWVLELFSSAFSREREKRRCEQKIVARMARIGRVVSDPANFSPVTSRSIDPERKREREREPMSPRTTACFAL